MAREYAVRLECGHPGCAEFGHYVASTRKEQYALYSKYHPRKWRCVRHTQPDEVLALSNLRRVEEVTALRSDDRLYWGKDKPFWGFLSGPGFKAYSYDFPEGTILRVTAEIILPDESAS